MILWDENDYSTAPNVNQVLVIVDTNYGVHGLQSDASYTHFSLLKTLDAGFGLPCLNHACDADAHVMADLFAMGKGDRDGDDEDEQKSLAVRGRESERLSLPGFDPQSHGRDPRWILDVAENFFAGQIHHSF